MKTKLSDIRMRFFSTVASSYSCLPILHRPLELKLRKVKCTIVLRVSLLSSLSPGGAEQSPYKTPSRLLLSESVTKIAEMYHYDILQMGKLKLRNVKQLA